MSLTLQCTSLCVILFDVSLQANAILQAIHLSKVDARDRDSNLPSTAECTLYTHIYTCFHELKQSDKLTNVDEYSQFGVQTREKESKRVL